MVVVAFAFVETVSAETASSSGISILGRHVGFGHFAFDSGWFRHSFLPISRLPASKDQCKLFFREGNTTH